MKPYKGYVGVARVDTDAGVIRGKVINTRDTITFQGTTVPGAEQAFRDSVDDYLEFCAEEGIEPERPFSGKFPVRTSPSVHRAASLAASRAGVSLNEYVERALIRAIRKPGRGAKATAREAAPPAPGPRAVGTRSRAKA